MLVPLLILTDVSGIKSYLPQCPHQLNSQAYLAGDRSRGKGQNSPILCPFSVVNDVSPPPLRGSAGLEVDGEPLRSASSPAEPPPAPPPPLLRVNPPVDAIRCRLYNRFSIN